MAQESVWDYPRPPKVENASRRVRVMFGGLVVADSSRAWRVLETSHPPVFYIPPEDVRMELLLPSRRSSYCEFKGMASYWDLNVGDKVAKDVGWSYANPSPGYEPLQSCIAFYASRVDACYVDEERVQPQPGDFYGGWITSNLMGPFKGGPGTKMW